MTLKLTLKLTFFENRKFHPFHLNKVSPVRHLLRLVSHHKSINICFISIEILTMYVFVVRFGLLGSIDSNTGSPDLGWDTDQFPMDIKDCAMVMKVS